MVLDGFCSCAYKHWLCTPEEHTGLKQARRRANEVKWNVNLQPTESIAEEAVFSSVETQPVRASNSQHMEARWLPTTQSGLHYLAHTGIIKEPDQRADYFSTAELQDSFLFVLSLCRPLFLFVVSESLLLVAFLSFFRSGRSSYFLKQRL